MERDEPSLVRPSTPARTRKASPDAAQQEDVVTIVFPQGLVGCPEWQHFALLPDPFEQFGELVCLDAPGICLVVADARALPVNCSFELDDADADALQLASADDAHVLVILNISREPPAVFANLAGPLVINWRSRVGRQVVLDHTSFPLRAPILTGLAARAVVDALSEGEVTGSAHECDPHHIPATTQGKGV
jgi:flagellar assembly factor FliW